MTIFEAVKTTVTPRMAAEHFGLNVSRNGMVCCPFHDDRHPSMKLYGDHYHCFGCQANGDVIAFTSKLFGITPLEAAQKLAADFGIREGRPEELEALLDKYIPGVEAMRTKLKKYDKTYKELTAENAEPEKELNSASRESIQKKLEIQRKLFELDELRRTVDSIPDAVIREYTEQKYVHHGRMNQEI